MSNSEKAEYHFSIARIYADGCDGGAREYCAKAKEQRNLGMHYYSK